MAKTAARLPRRVPRADCRVLHSILCADPELAVFERPLLLMGHGQGTKGMSTKEQERVAAEFQGSGATG